MRCAPHHRPWPATVLLLLWSTTGGHAQGVLSLEQAWQLALRNSLPLQQQAVLVRQAQEEVAIQQAEYRPTLATVATYGFTSETARLALGPAPAAIKVGTRNRYDVAAVAQQPLYTGHRTRNLVGAAQQQEQALATQQQALGNQLLLQVGQVFYQAQLNQVQQHILQQGIERAAYHLQRVRSLHQAGQATAFDTLEVANHQLQMKNQLAQLQRLHGILLSRLAYLAGMEVTPQVPDLALEQADLRSGELPAWQERAPASRPELRQFASLRQAQEHRVRALESAYAPQLALSAGYHLARPGVDQFHDRWMDYGTVGLDARWQWWDAGQDRRQAAKARLESMRLDLQEQQLRKDVRQQVDEAYQQVQTAREQFELQRHLVAQEQERYRLIRQSYGQGYATSLDLSTAAKDLTAAELVLQQNYGEWLQARLQLHFAAGAIGSYTSGG
jgi:OMF family outer membrane factor